MKTLNPNNRNPRNGLHYEDIADLVISQDRDEVGVGNNTIAFLDSDDHLLIQYHSTIVAKFYDEDNVQLWMGDYKTAATKKRLDWVLSPLGYRLKSINRVWKVYSIHTGAYRDFSEGMFITKGQL